MLYIIDKNLNQNINTKYLKSMLDIHAALDYNHKQLYLVGGSVRDLLLGKQPKDYDFCTDATPEELKTIFKGYKTYSTIDTGLKHGTITVHDKVFNVFFEITTYRIDGEYSDSRHPDNVVFTPSLEEDLKRRDFTINAFAYDFYQGKLLMLDKTYLDDLNLGIIRAVGDPNKRFNEDALRMMRAIRFSSQLNFVIESNTWKAIQDCASLIENVSKERVRDELTKLICSNYPEKLAFLYYTTLSNYVMPMLNRMMECGQHNKWHYLDVAHHTFEVMRGVKATPIMRWAALLHDCGKPDTKFLGKDGWEHFYGHADVGAKLAEEYLTSLKFDNYSKDTIVTLIKYHDIDIKPNMTRASCRRNFQKFITKDTNLVQEYLELHRADAFAHKLNNPMQTMEELSFASNFYEEMLNEKQPMLIKHLKVNGDDLKLLGLEGKEIGKTLNYLLECVVEKPELNDYDTLINMVKTAIQEEGEKYNVF